MGALSARAKTLSDNELAVHLERLVVTPSLYDDLARDAVLLAAARRLRKRPPAGRNEDVSLGPGRRPCAGDPV